MPKFKRKCKRSVIDHKPVSLFDAVYSKQTKDVKIHAGLMDVFYSQSTSIRSLNKLKSTHGRKF